MRAVVFKAPFDVAVEDVADPQIEQPTDALIRITTANICGSDLHPYEGRAPLDAGMVLGTKTWAWSRRPALAPTGSRPGTGCRFRSISRAGPAATARPDGRARACARTRPAVPRPGMAIR